MDEDVVQDREVAVQEEVVVVVAAAVEAVVEEEDKSFFLAKKKESTIKISFFPYILSFFLNSYHFVMVDFFVIIIFSRYYLKQIFDVKLSFYL